jgi:hypothetical protein
VVPSASRLRYDALDHTARRRVFTPVVNERVAKEFEKKLCANRREFQEMLPRRGAPQTMHEEPAHNAPEAVMPLHLALWLFFFPSVRHEYW